MSVFIKGDLTQIILYVFGEIFYFHINLIN